MGELQEKYLNTNGIATHYWEIGSGEAMILLHGGGAGADAFGNWSRIMPKFAETGFRVIAFDAVGFGKSNKPDPQRFEYNLNARVDQLISLIRSLELDNVTLIGNSMGGATSLRAAKQQPELVQRLILMGTAGRLKQAQKSDRNHEFPGFRLYGRFVCVYALFPESLSSFVCTRQIHSG
ncbi:alpha/beta fold hydrolase [Effusibacillus dendaii]|uniref:AB hydrolase-1 domain-containing protein n=1 Tax=Effusibacillus dendaii TaxID=2743772 RepID=A0A7I8D9K3_9BACL|nr:alpha/beta hydrolase [Effusibacillus dendaii]BCJ85210.1 hypothetical protein skT53_01950 [Effusibacillus dendaii]